MTTVQRNAITSPAEGLFVFDTDLDELYVYDGTAWKAANKLNTNWLKTTNNAYFNNSGNVGIGVINPSAKLDVDGDLQLARNSHNGSIILGNGNASPKWQISTESAGLYNYQGT